MHLRPVLVFAAVVLLTPALIYATSAARAGVSGCEEITQPGTYTLGGDIASSLTSACISIHDTHNVTLDCANHTISAKSGFGPTVSVTNTSNFKITRCSLQTDPQWGTPLSISNGQAGTITQDTITGFSIQVSSSSALQINHNTLRAPYNQEFTSGTVFSNNTAILPGNRDYSAVFYSAFGGQNKIVNNTLDGGARGIAAKHLGADDGIFLKLNENHDVIQYNLIRNVYDCGIENSEILANTLITDNTIQNVGVCGIGGWYANAYVGNTIKSNTVTDAPMLLNLYRSGGLQPQYLYEGHLVPGETAIYFQNNTFTGNKLQNQRQSGFSSTVSMRIPPDWGPLVASNNTFKNNDFGSTEALFLAPFSMIKDGGGNMCKSTGEADYPLRCLSAPLSLGSAAHTLVAAVILAPLQVLTKEIANFF